MAKSCAHTDHLQAVKPRSDGCEECLRTGDEWEHLRLCLTCGHVGCCDDSKNKHATAHFHSTGHPVIESLEPGEGWRWCYLDEIPLAAEIKEAALAYEGNNVMRDDTQAPNGASNGRALSARQSLPLVADISANGRSGECSNQFASGCVGATRKISSRRSS